MGDYDNLLAPREIVNGLNKKGELSAFNQAGQYCTGGGGVWSIRGDTECITQVIGNTGGGFVTMCKAPPGGLGNGTKPPTGERRTHSFLAGTGQVDRPTLTMMKNPDGTGMTCDSGGGRNSTILIATGDGQSGALFTKGFVALFCDGTELILHGAAGKITSTYHLIQETNKGKGSVSVKTFSA